MNLSLLRSDWQGAMSENFLLRFLLGAMVIGNLMLVIFMTSQDAIITLVPPEINEEISIAQDDASASFKKTWGLFAAELIGNAKVSNVDFILKALEPMLASEIVGQMRQTLAAQIQEIKSEGLSMSFEPKNVSYENSTHKVFVFGAQTISGRNGDTITNKRTIEVGVEIINYKPVIFFLDAYNTMPKFTKSED
jgi:conjugal transfer pilus assembly protein TraE